MPHVGHPKPLMSEDTTPFSSLYVRLSPDNFPSPPPRPCSLTGLHGCPDPRTSKGSLRSSGGMGVMEEAPVLGGPTRGHEELPHVPMGEPGLADLMSEL